MTSPLIEPHLYERPRSVRRSVAVRGLGGWLTLLLAVAACTATSPPRSTTESAVSGSGSSSSSTSLAGTEAASGTTGRPVSTDRYRGTAPPGTTKGTLGSANNPIPKVSSAEEDRPFCEAYALFRTRVNDALHDDLSEEDMLEREDGHAAFQALDDVAAPGVADEMHAVNAEVQQIRTFAQIHAFNNGDGARRIGRIEAWVKENCGFDPRTAGKTPSTSR